MAYIYFSYFKQDSDSLFKVEADIESNALLGCYALSPEFGVRSDLLITTKARD